MEDAVSKLAELDPSDSMASVLAAVSEVLDIIEGGSLGRDADQALGIIFGKEAEAMEYYMRPLDDDKVYDRLIDLHSQRGEGDKVAHYKRDLRQARKWTILGDSQAVAGNHARAVQFLKRALFFGPMEDVVHEVQSALERSEKRMIKAQKELPKVLAKLDSDPRSEKLLREAAGYMLDLDRLDESEDYNGRLLKISSDDFDALYQKGCLLFSRGDYAGSLSLFETLKERKPDSLNVKRCYNWSLQMLDMPE